MASSNRWWVVLLSSLIVVGWETAGLSHQASKEATLHKIGPAPPFSLTTQDGTQLSLQALRGKVVVVTFIYTTCADTCPLLTAKLARLPDRLDPEFSHKVFFASITVDPERDTPGMLKQYAQRHKVDLTRSAFLTGTSNEIRDVARNFGVAYRKTRRGEVDHTFLTSIVDQSGILRVQYMGVRFDPDEFLHDLQNLLREER
jgi:protein SCO1